MPKDRPPSYTPAPEPPTDPELRRRYDAIMSVLAQTQTVTAAAASVGMSRNHFQTILHRVLTAIIDAMTPKPAGRPAKPEREAELEQENARLRKELTALQDHSSMITRMMEAMTSISSGRESFPRSRARSKGTKKKDDCTKKKDDDPEPATTLHLAVMAMRNANVPMAASARVLGVSESTARRNVTPPRPRQKSPTHEPNTTACQRVRDIVRATHGLVGARSLGKRCGLARRVAAAIKKRELREMELERKARCGTVSVLAPGLIRGFDAMHIRSVDGRVYWLVAADAAIPYRTSIAMVPVYDATNVIATLEADFECHGPPLVLRMDRIACQRTPDVHNLLARYHVLPLHGPPRHPYYYGQLERQNREHRAWERVLVTRTRAELADAACAMKSALNGLWARPTLDWCTAEEAWQRRAAVDIDRRELITEVERRASGLISSGYEALTARRIATEMALIQRGLLALHPGGTR